MPTPEEMAATLLAIKANAEVKDKPLANDTEAAVTDKAEIEKALADTVEPVEDAAESVRLQIVAILNEYNNEVTNIPRSSEYWRLMNRYQSLRNP